jgi:hypothetical protein
LKVNTVIRKPNPHTLITEPGDKVDIGGALAAAVITVGDEAADVRAISIQLNDGQGQPLGHAVAAHLALLADADGQAFAATGGSTGIAIGASGALLPLVAKKAWLAISDDAGVIDLTWTDTGTEAAYLAVILPNGDFVVSDALTNAA